MRQDGEYNTQNTDLLYFESFYLFDANDAEI